MPLADPERHIRDLVEQVLLTSPGERVNRPTFGTGLRQLIFAPANSEVAMATQYMIQGALQQWLGDLVKVEAVSVEAQDTRLEVTVHYLVRHTQQRHAVRIATEAAQ